MLTLLSVGALSVGENAATDDSFDNHVHIMSPALIKLFKAAGIPFSKPDNAYSDINVISERLGTKRFKMVSMAYLWGHPEFGKVNNEYEMVKAENDFVLENLKWSMILIRAYCGINPLKDYALEEVKRCRKAGANGIKLHFNANQIYLTEPEHVAKLKPIFEYAGNKKLPLLVHFDNSHPKTGARDVKILFEQILSDIRPIDLQIAHFGTSGGFNEKTKVIIDAFLEQFENVSKHNKKHRITFDISAVALDKDSEGVPKLTAEEFKELSVYVRKLGMNKISFGTDYPLYPVDEYIGILRERVGMTEDEIKAITRLK